MPASCSPAELVTLHLADQKSYYFISKKAPFLTVLPQKRIETLNVME